jgi:hypothetical protein
MLDPPPALREQMPVLARRGDLLLAHYPSRPRHRRQPGNVFGGANDVFVADTLSTGITQRGNTTN